MSAYALFFFLSSFSSPELLLPLVHKTWSALMARFRDQHAVVVEKAFQLLTVLTRTAGDFLRARASSEVMPPLLTFLIRGAGVSAVSCSQASEYSLQALWQLDFGLVWTLLSMQVPKECQDEVFGASVRDTFCYPLQIRQPSSADRRRINVARLKSILSRLYKIVPVTNPVV
ncbi:hypothetical protein AHF37_09632 [Paragonimus kellicotti]|nr:hypothetical protein AHF37_09632 [Paragonimus kellicotti]